MLYIGYDCFLSLVNCFYSALSQQSTFILFWTLRKLKAALMLFTITMIPIWKCEIEKITNMLRYFNVADHSKIIPISYDLLNSLSQFIYRPLLHMSLKYRIVFKNLLEKEKKCFPNCRNSTH